MLEAVVVEPSSKQAKSCVIWLHGLGADGYDFLPIVEQLSIQNTRFILPHAPHRPVTINNNYEMPAWYDIYGFEANSPQDEIGIKTTQKQIEEIIEHQLSQGILSQNILLAGFSQGGAIALYTGLRFKHKLAGILALSTYLPLKDKFDEGRSDANRNIPIMMAHGTLDNVITLSRAKSSAELLEKFQYPLEWHEYPMGHSLCDKEIEHIESFLQNNLNTN